MIEDNEIYNSIVREFELEGSILEKMEEAVETLTKSRMEICKVLKITKFNAETLVYNEQDLIRDININKSNIKDYEKHQIELKDKIKLNKQEIKVVKININKLNGKYSKEKQESRNLSEALRIFISREKFKLLKRFLVRRYRKVFMKYSNVLIIKTKIVEGNRRKEKIRGEKRNSNDSIASYNRKITMDKLALAEMRKSIIIKQKGIDFFIIKLQSLEEYKERETKFKLEFQQYEKLN